MTEIITNTQERINAWRDFVDAHIELNHRYAKILGFNNRNFEMFYNQGQENQPVAIFSDELACLNRSVIESVMGLESWKLDATRYQVERGFLPENEMIDDEVSPMSPAINASFNWKISYSEPYGAQGVQI